MIPEGWTVGTIKDFVKSLDAGVSVNGEDRLIKNGEIGVLKVSAVSYGTFIPNEHKVVYLEEIHRLTIYPKKDRILISRANTPTLVGANVYIDRDYPNLFLPDKLWQIEPLHNNFSVRWLSYLIASDDSKTKISSYATGTSMGMKNISKINFLNIEIIVPPISEQYKIAEILSTWDKAIALLEQLITAKRKLKQGLMQQLLTGKKQFKEFEGSKWEITKIKDIGKVVSGGTPDTNNPDYWNGDIFWCTPSEITVLKDKYISFTNRKISTKGVKSSSTNILPINSLLVCTRATIGYCAINTVSMCTNQGFKNLIPKKQYSINYLYYKLMLERHQLLRLSSGSTFLEISKKDFESIELDIPSSEEQQKIASILSTADAEISILEKQLAAYKQQKRGLMQQLLTGKKRVKID